MLHIITRKRILDRLLRSDRNVSSGVVDCIEQNRPFLSASSFFILLPAAQYIKFRYESRLTLCHRRRKACNFTLIPTMYNKYPVKNKSAESDDTCRKPRGSTRWIRIFIYTWVKNHQRVCPRISGDIYVLVVIIHERYNPVSKLEDQRERRAGQWRAVLQIYTASIHKKLKRMLKSGAFWRPLPQRIAVVRRRDFLSNLNDYIFVSCYCQRMMIFRTDNIFFQFDLAYLLLWKLSTHFRL